MKTRTAISRALLAFALLAICAGTALAQTSPAGSASGTASRKGENNVVLEVGREKFTLKQIADAYKKNGSRGGASFYDLDRDSAEAFIKLYIDYRLKVQAAIDAGLNKRPELIEELATNRAQLAFPPAPASGYLIERKVVDPAVQRIFNRRKEEVKVGVIFSAMRPGDPADTLRAYQRSMRILDMLKRGGDFSRLALDSSNDEMTKATGGMIYITSGMFYPALEEAAYTAKPGELHPVPLKVPGGYVVLKTIERVPRVRVHPAYIFFAIPNAADSATVAAVRARGAAALARIRKGEDFAVVAREVSEDQTSAQQGGDLISFYTRSLGFETRNGKLQPAFENALYALKDGGVSDLVRTNEGFNIIKRIESRVPTFEEEKDVIRQMYRQYFLNDARTEYVRSVLQKQGLKIENNAFGQLLSSVDRTRTSADSAWARGITPELRKLPLYTFRGNTVTVGAWVDSVETRRDFRALPLSSDGIRRSFETMLEPIALAEESMNLEKEYPEFAALMQEFRDGIMIFKLEEEIVWSKLNDTARSRQFFEKNQRRYLSQPRVGISEIYVYKQDEMKNVQSQLASGVSFDTLAARHTQRQGYRDRAGRWEPNTPRNADIVKQTLAQKPDAKVGDVIGPFSYQGGLALVRINSIDAPRPMSYEEARMEGAFIDDFQKELTEEWLKTLRLKYTVKVNERAIQAALG